MRVILVFFLVYFFDPPAADAQEHPRPDSTARSRPPPIPGFKLSLFPEKLFPAARTDAAFPLPSAAQPSLAERLFTDDMVRDATLPDPNRNIPWYRSDPRYYRITETSFRVGETPSSWIQSLSGNLELHSLLTTALRGLAIHFREDLAYGKRGPQDYFALPNNTGQFRTFGDVREEALRRSEMQSFQINGGMRSESPLFPLPFNVDFRQR